MKNLFFVLGLHKKNSSRLAIIASLLIVAFLRSPIGVKAFRVNAQPKDGYWFDVQYLYAADFGLSQAAGVTFVPEAQGLLVLDDSAGADRAHMALITKRGELLGRYDLALNGVDPANLAYSVGTGEAYLLDALGQRLLEVSAAADPRFTPAQRAVRTLDARTFGIHNPRGMSIDPLSGRVYILDAEEPEILVLPPGYIGGNGGAENSNRIERIRLRSLEGRALRGLAYNPETDLLYVYDPDNNELYGLNQRGQIETTYSLSGLSHGDLQGMVFADSTDPTDDPAEQNLFLADSGENSSVIELSLLEVNPQEAPPGSLPTTLVNIIHSSNWVPPNPDTSGVEFLYPSNRLFVVDGEVEEMDIYQGVNTWIATNTGEVLATCTTVSYSVEPTGVAANPDNGHLFFSDDNQRRVFEIDLGPDQTYCTPDDVVTSFSTWAYFNEDNNDPEGIAYGAGKLYIADGVGQEVYVIDPGPNGIFDEAPPAGDDIATHFDVEIYGLDDPEGIGYHWERGTLFIVSRGNDYAVEVSTDGLLLNYYDITSANILAPAGAAIGYGSQNPAVMNLYVGDRGVDNGQDPDENDGAIYEINFDSGGPTATPTNTPTITPTESDTPTFTPTSTPSDTPTATDTATETLTPTVTDTPTITPTATDTGTPTPTSTPTDTPTATGTATDTLTPTATDTPTITPTATDTETPTPTSTLTDTPTATATDTPTITPTATDTETPTPTSTLTDTPTAPATDTPTATSTPTDTPTSTSTATNTPTSTATNTATNTPTPTATHTPTVTPKPPTYKIYLPLVSKGQTTMPGARADGLSAQSQGGIWFNGENMFWEISLEQGYRHLLDSILINILQTDAVSTQPFGRDNLMISPYSSRFRK